ncbi:peptidoglycan DD-metalloendopeptidase family protein [Paenibacillus sp. LMG 31459]|uniref:Peptidoglycan DD-metalloendopeptidase family protein n=1 Tax=Paenibacillus phytohabitans TaxID=2654978 RepID=A0ABX1YPH4_9BACL|nr:M23 family metallopeptidase [Paenibacillus phytohabitans]NOU82852.1 peptidoglycan DD-metalloendopeptidase family protein [Paenibacillus phytohabitans]
MPALFRSYNTRRTLICMSAAALLWGSSPAMSTPAHAARYHELPELTSSGPVAADSKEAAAAARKGLYEQMSAATGIPWFRFAAIDQYERSVAKKKKGPAASEADSAAAPARLTGISIPAPVWSGPLNPNQEDKFPESITFFGGFGRDGTGDGIADPGNDIDVLYSMAEHLLKYGRSSSDFSIGIWEYYHNGRAAQRIAQFAKLYEHFGRLDLSGSAFPLPIGTNYAYRSTWGTGRSWGGARVHEGTDLFAPHGLTVRSTCFGVVETKGWNRYGGWRIGIRDIENRYHYYAHLMGYEKSLSRGDIVIPGQTIGWVGSSGYGSPGTQGKFPPHLHYGIYRDRGITEWAFDPYPLLKQWENQEFGQLKKNKNKK